MSTEKENDYYIDVALSLLRELEGVRVAGTEGEKRARDVIKKYILKTGSEVEEEDFQLYISTGISGNISVCGKEIDARPYGLSVPYEEEGTLLYFDHPEEALSIKNNLSGVICLFAVNPKYEDILTLKQKGCRGFIVAQRPIGKLASYHLRQKAIKDDAVLPSCVIRYEDAVSLLDCVGKKIVMKGEGKTFNTTSYNIIVKIPGIENTEEQIIITGHYDTVPYAPGFSDNGAGVATMFSLLYYFKKHPIMRGLTFIFFSGEEWGLLGSQDYVKRHKDTLKDIVLGINLDVGGPPVGHLMSRITGNNSLYEMVRSLLKNKGIYAEVKKGIYSSDSIPFAREHVPFVNLSRVGGKSTSYIHTEGDRGYFYRKEGFLRHVKSALSIIEYTGCAEHIPFDRGIDDDVRKELEEYIKERF